MSMLKYFTVICVTVAVTVCEAKIAIEAPALMEASAGHSTSLGATPDPNALKVTPLRLAIDLVDGSRVIGVPTITSIPVQTSYAKMDVPLEKIMNIHIHDDHEMASIDLQNGDKLKGVLNLGPIKLETVFGWVSIGIEHMRECHVTVAGGVLPAGDGSLDFGGVKWTPLRTLFEVQGDKVVSLPKARPGFRYGHSGNGRGATLLSNVGSADWTDYSMEFEFCMRGVDRAFNPHGLAMDHRAGYIMFHLVDAKESWNESGSSTYRLSLSSDGRWGLGCSYNQYCHVASGYGNPKNDGVRSLVKGKGLNLDPHNGNTFRIDVRGTRIQIWVDGEKIADVEDEKMRDSIGGKTLDHGGVGFSTPWECMIWIRNFSAKRL
ncbi:MAG: hypothetical protein HN919_16975 [Verrucomicrobia bacterium]|nr:hypothetical protein [Verrucomicrobiota bacterium]MBT7698985.1 hypothetical protein [Verrucomicrobiota bacterium]